MKMTFLKLALKNLVRRRVRTILTIVGVAIAVSALFSLSAFKSGYEKQLNNEVSNMGINLLAVPKGCPYEAASLIMHGGVIPNYLTSADLEATKTIDGVAVATPMLLQQFVKNGNTHIVYGIEADEMLQIKPWWKVDGRFFGNNEKNVMVLGSSVASKANLLVGDKMSFGPNNESFTVVGILQQTNTQDDEFHYLPLAEAQRIFDKSGLITTVAVKINDITRISEISTKLQEIPDVQVVTTAQITGTILNLVGSAQKLLISVIIIAIIIAIVGIINTLLMSVNERAKEFGMMKAIGASGFDIGKLVVIETLIITVTGGIVGSLFSIAASGLIETFVKGIIPYAPAGTLISPDIGLVALCILFTVVIGLVCGIYPAIKSSRMSPIAAIRSSVE
jgi:putative ABC transport system permease protein